MIYRAKRKKGYTLMSNDVFKNNLSCEACGMLCYLLSLPDDWVIYKTSLHKNFGNCGREKSDRIFKELVEKGYIITVKKVNEKGHFTYEHIVYEDPYNGEPQTQIPHTEPPHTGLPYVADNSLLNTNLPITELHSNDIYTTKTKEEKEYKEKVFDFKSKLLEEGFKENLVNDWMKVRKNKKATNSETAYNMFMSEIKKMQADKNKVLEKIIASDWKGFEASWLAEWQKSLPKEPKLQSVHNFENENAYNRYYDMYVQECMKLGYIPKQKEKW